MKRQLPSGLSEAQRAALSQFYAGHISAGELSERLTSVQCTPTPPLPVVAPGRGSAGRPLPIGDRPGLVQRLMPRRPQRPPDLPAGSTAV